MTYSTSKPNRELCTRFSLLMPCGDHMVIAALHGEDGKDDARERLGKLHPEAMIIDEVTVKVDNS